MKALITAAREFALDEDGITSIEYGLIAALVASFVVIAFTSLGTAIKGAFTSIGNKITASLPA